MVDRTKFQWCFSVTFVYVTSVLVLLSGIATLGLGIWLFTVSNNITYLLEEVTLFVVAIMTITLGTISILAGLFGFFGNSKENKYIIFTYGIVLVILIFTEFGVGITALVYQDKVRIELEDNLQTTIKHDYKPNYGDPGAVTAVDYLQKECKCCGADGPSDWHLSFYNIQTGYKVPKSCCLQGDKCQYDQYYSSGIYQEGCTTNGGDWVQENLIIVGATSLGVIAIHGIALLAVICFRWLIVSRNRLI